MSYLHGRMLEGERVVCSARPHKIALVRPLGLLAVSAAILLVAVLDDRMRALTAVAVLPALVAIPSWLRFITTEYVITNRRLCVRTGVLHVTSFETVLNKVGTVGIEQSLAGRALGYGTVVIRGLGGNIECLPRISQPFTLRQKMHEALAVA